MMISLHYLQVAEIYKPEVQDSIVEQLRLLQPKYFLIPHKLKLLCAKRHMQQIILLLTITIAINYLAKRAITFDR